MALRLKSHYSRTQIQASNMVFGPSRPTDSALSAHHTNRPPSLSLSLSLLHSPPGGRGSFRFGGLAGDGREQDGFPGLSVAPADCELDPAVFSSRAKATSGTASSSLLHR